MADDGAPEVPTIGLSRLVADLRNQLAQQEQVIAALIDAAEQRSVTASRVGPQHVIERRTAKAHQAERLLRSVIEALEGALCIVGEDGTVLDANRQWLRWLPFGTPHRPGEVGTDFFAWCRSVTHMPEIAQDVAVLVRNVLAAGPGDHDDSTRHDVKGRWLEADGTERWVVVRVRPIRDNLMARAVVSLVDITDGMTTQQLLRDATDEAHRLALVAKATSNGVVITLPDGSIEWVNESFSRRTGYCLADVVGKHRTDLLQCEGAPAEFTEFVARVERAQTADGEFPLVSRSGERYWAGIQVRPVFEDGRVAHVVWVEQDVTARRDTQQRLHAAITQAELLAAALSQEKHLLTGVISAVPQLVYWKDAEGRYVGCNAAYLSFRGLMEPVLLGRTDAGLPSQDALTAELAALELEVTGSGVAVIDRKMELADSRGRIRSLLVSVLPLDGGAAGRGVIGVGADITRARELERQLAHANRLESIGQLAAGVAHELNTPVQYVADNVAFLTEATSNLLSATEELARLAADDPPEVELATQLQRILRPLELDFLSQEIPGALAESKEGLARVTEIVRAMKDFAHPGTDRREIDVNRAIESTVQVCRNEWKYVARLELDLDPAAGLVPCFEGDLKQVILNVIVNASQAIAEDERRREDGTLGRISITTRRTTDEMLITIADDGPGMDAKVRQRVFDPFFTTKDVGKGSGQGLSLAHSVIVTKHQGRIDLDTAPGKGARFTLHLPLHPTPHPGESGGSDR